MPPAYVKPYVKRYKNDATDAEAICEAVTRANMRFVATKTPEQQSCLTLHRTRHLFNRAPVDFTAMEHSLDETSPAELSSNWADGRIKQLTIARILAVRKNIPRVFSLGAYVPLETAGPLAQHVLAFARILNKSAAITAFCRAPAQLLSDDGSLNVPFTRWKETRILIPPELIDATFSASLQRSKAWPLERVLDVSRIFFALPVAFLVSHPNL